MEIFKIPRQPSAIREHGPPAAAGGPEFKAHGDAPLADVTYSLSTIWCPGTRRRAMTDRALPMGFLVFTAFASGLVWLLALANHLPVR